LSGGNLAFGNSVHTCFARERFRAKREQVAPFAKERVRRWPRFDEFAVGREHGGGAGDVRQQTVCSVRQGDLAPGAFGGHDQYCRGVVRERDARAQTYQHTTERRTEAA
jgi:hypothetical protein